MKRTLITAIVLMLCLIVPCFGSGGQSVAAPARTGIDPLLNLTGYPIAKEKVTLNFTACRPAGFRNSHAEMQVFQDLEKLTNVHINWNEVEEAAWAERTRLMLAALDLPDSFWGWPIADLIVQEYGEQGVLVPLNQYIDNYAYNVLNAFKELPTLRTAMTYPDGNIYALPMANIGENGGNFLFLNMEWMAEARQSIPKTTEEFYNVLKAFKGIHPDVQPFTFAAYTPQGMVNQSHGANNMFGPFGVVYDDRYLMWQNNTVIFAPSHPGYLEGLRYFNRLYNEGLLDPEVFSQTPEQYQAKTKAGRGAAISHMADFIIPSGDPNAPVRIATLDDYDAYIYQAIGPLYGPSGQRPVWRRNISFPGENTGRFMITNINKHPEISMRWVDYACDNDEGANNIRNGPLDLLWEYVNPEKTKFTMIASPNVVPGVTYHPSNYSVWFWLPSYNLKNVRVASQEHQSINYERHVKEYCLDNVPFVKFTSQENERMSSFRVDLFRYVASSFANFTLNGVTDAQWNEYLARLRGYGSDTYVQMYQAAVNRNLGR